jgi:hypothetical protein
MAKQTAFLLIGVVIFVITGCSEKFYERQDKKTGESQLHLPKNIQYLSFRSNPKIPGWFGREGLWIRAEIQFTDSQFEEYVAKLDDPAVWKPVRFKSYSPSIGRSYSPKSLQWADLPLPACIRDNFRKDSPLKPELVESEKGKYYCSAIVFQITESPKRENKNPFNWEAAGWRYVGRSCEEISESKLSAVIFGLAILDFDTKRMSVYFQFSG